MANNWDYSREMLRSRSMYPAEWLGKLVEARASVTSSVGDLSARSGGDKRYSTELDNDYR